MKAWLALALALLALVVGCAAPEGTERVPGILAATLAGAEDVELSYEVDPSFAYPGDAASGGFGEDLRALVLRRLGAGRVGADVTQEGRRVRIVVDEGLGPRVDELVTWTGVLLVLVPDGAVALTPREGTGLERRRAGAEEWYEGARADVLRAIESWPIDREHRLVAEPVAEGRYRTRVVRVTPVGQLGDGAMVGWADGARLRIRGVSGSVTAATIDAARARGAPVVVARGRVSLGAPAIEGESLFLSFDAESSGAAYLRAQHERHLLTTPRLPPLRRTGALGLPPNRKLAIACLVVPAALSLAWLAFVRRFDRAHPEPRWLVGITFALGALATVPAGLVEQLLSSASPWLDPDVVTFGGQKFALPLAFVVDTIVVGLAEEGAKRLAAHFALRRPEFDEPVDGIVYAIVAALGFAAAENVRYFALGRMSAPLVIARCFMSVPAHMFFATLWGHALGARLVDPARRAWPWLLIAAAAHGLFDALLSIEDAGIFAVLLNVGLASAFVLLVRRALRHGVVTAEMLAIKPEERTLFRVGRPGLFWLSAAALHALAFGIFLLGAFYQLSLHRPSAVFVVGSSVMLALLAAAALGVARAMPLDVAIDAYGVTFAGAARSWRKIRGFSARADQIELDAEPSPIELGPAAPETLEAIATELRRRVGGDGTPRLDTLESHR